MATNDYNPKINKVKYQTAKKNFFSKVETDIHNNTVWTSMPMPPMPDVVHVPQNLQTPEAFMEKLVGMVMHRDGTLYRNRPLWIEFPEGVSYLAIAIGGRDGIPEYTLLIKDDWTWVDLVNASIDVLLNTTWKKSGVKVYEKPKNYNPNVIRPQ